MAVATIFSAGAGAALPLMNVVFGRLVGTFNNYFIPGSGVTEAEFRSSVNQNSLYIVYLFIGKLVLGYISTYAFRMTGIRISAAIRMAYLTALFNQPMSAIDKLPPGTATDSLTTVANTIQQAISDKLGILVQGTALIVAAYIIAFLHSWSLTLVSSSMVLFVCIASGATAPLFFKYDKLVAESNSGAAALATEALRAIRTVKSLSAENQLMSRYNRWITEAQVRGLRKSIWVAAQFWPAFFSMYANMGLTFWFGVKLYVRDDISNVGTVVVVLFSVLIVLGGIGQIFAPLQNISKASASAGTCFKIIDAPQLNHGGLKEPEVKQELDMRFDNVTFAYPSRPQAYVLTDLSFSVPAGKVTAFVGQSGCGKSTIVALLERWYDLSDVNEALPEAKEESERDAATKKKSKKDEKKDSAKTKQAQDEVVNLQNTILQNSGQVYYGPHNIETLDRKWWRSQIGLVQQEPVLFNEPIYENVAKGLIGSLWEQEPYDSKVKLVKEACREAFADDFIMRLPDGYDTLVGESGIKLSGGQRQRLAIARAIIKRPSILILDEATSSLDVRGERVVAAALEQASKGRTTIVIAHRMSTIRNADHIVVLKNGSAVEEGTHTELVAKEDGVYANLLRAQHVELSAQGEFIEEQNDPKLLPRDLAEESYHKSSSGQEQPHTDRTGPKIRGFIRSVGTLLYEQRTHRLFYLLILLAAMGAGVAYSLQAYLFSHLIVVFQKTGNQLISDTNFWALMLFLLAICVGICYGIIGWISNSLSVYVGTTCRRSYFDSVLYKPIAFFDEENHSVGTLSGQLSTDPQQLQEVLGTNMVFPLIAVFNLVSCTIISFVFGWKLTLVVLFAALPVILGAAFFRIRYELQFEAMNAKVFADSSQFASEAVGAFRTVSALTLENTILHRYQTLLRGHIRNAFMKGRLSVLVFALSDSLELCSMALGFWYGGQLLATREYNVLQFILIYTAVVLGGQACGQFLAFGPNVAYATAAANRILGFRADSEPKMPDTFVDPNHNDRGNGIKIEFRDVGFTYPTRESAVYRQLSFEISPGEYVAFVGPSGCGKTTIVSLLERFYAANSGQILIDGTELQKVPIPEYRSLCGLVSQEPTLFEGTVRENLVLGLPAEPSQDEIDEACRMAEIYDFITSLPKSFDTDLAAGTHASLSGGQKQRMCIARAFLRKPRILLLDEATNNLDGVSAGLVQQAVEHIASTKSMTVVVVVHRLASVQRADRIIVLGEGGVVLEEGTHLELLQRKGAYWGMCKIQALDQ